MNVPVSPASQPVSEPTNFAISVIVPVGKRHGDLAQLHAEYRAAMETLGLSYEFIFVLDGFRPAAEPALRAIVSAHPRTKLVALTRPFGEATALMAGFHQSTGEIILTLPAYHQIEADEVSKLLQGLESRDLVVGQRWPRAGGWLERLRRNVFHRMIATVTGIRFNDLGCGARAMRRRVLAEVSLYGDQHRFLPLLAERQGFRTGEVQVRQSKLDRFDGKYRAREYAHRALDIFTVFFLVRFTRKPLRFFGMVGVITFTAGALLTTWIIAERLIWLRPLADRPAFLLSSLLVVLGLQLFALGLLGELIIFVNARDQKDYQVDQVVDFSGEAS